MSNDNIMPEINYNDLVIKDPTIRCEKHGANTRPFTVDFLLNGEHKYLSCCQECLYERLKEWFDTFPQYEVME